MSKMIKITGAIGPCVSSKQCNSCVSDEHEVGVSGTNKWKINGIDSSTTLAIYFKIDNNVIYLINFYSDYFYFKSILDVFNFSLSF